MDSNGDTLWAWQAEESPGIWSIIAVTVPAFKAMFDGPIPFVHRDRQLVDQFREMAREHSRETGMDLRLARFELAEVAESVDAVMWR